MEQKSKKRVLYDRGLRILLWVCASITCLLLLLLLCFGLVQRRLFFLLPGKVLPFHHLSQIAL